MNAMGDKIASKKMAIDAKVPIISGVDYAIKETDEAMKMETTVVSKVNGTVDRVCVKQGDSVHQGNLLISFHIAKED